MTNLYQDFKKVKMEKEILMKVYILFMKVKDQLLMLSINSVGGKRLIISTPRQTFRSRNAYQ